MLELATGIGNYLESVGDLYDGNSEQKSVMLMTAMEMWMSMDERTVKLFPLMKDYNPGLPSDSLVCIFTPGEKTAHVLKSLRTCSQIYLHDAVTDPSLFIGLLAIASPSRYEASSSDTRISPA
jgi:hypothetical protein